MFFLGSPKNGGTPFFTNLAAFGTLKVLLTVMASGTLRHDVITFNTAVASAPWTESFSCLKRCQEARLSTHGIWMFPKIGGFYPQNGWGK